MAQGREVEVKFRRDLGLLEITMIGLGPTIGTTIFLLVGPGYAITGPSLILAFGLNFVVTMFTAMAYMELGSAFPETGGGYLWIRRSMRDPWGFLGGWMSWFGHCIVASFYIYGFGLGTVLALKTVLGTPSLALFGFGESALTRIFAVVAASFFFVLNYRGAKLTGRSETAVTFVLVGIVVSFVVFGLAHLFSSGPLPVQNFNNFFRGDSPFTQFLALLGAMGFTFIVFEGYEIIAQTGEEARNPEKNIPRAHFLVIGLSTIIFISVAFTAILAGGGCVNPLSAGCQLLRVSDGKVLGNNDAIADIAARVMPYGLQIIVFGVALGALAALNSMIFSSSRVAFAMGRDGGLPRALGKLHPKKRTPHVAITVSGLIIVTMTLTLDINTVAASADIMFLLLFLMVNWAAIVLRRTMPDVKRYYMMPLFPIIPILGIATKFLIAISLWAIEPVAWLIALGWIGIGLSVHYLHERKEIVVGVTKVVESILPRRRPRYRILLPIEDFQRVELVEFGALIAQVEDAELTLLHVIEVPPALPIDAIDRAYVSEVRYHLGKLRRRAEELGAYATARVDVSHKVFDSILDNIREDETDLLILGWRGGWRRGRILGTNVDRFVQEAPCDVVVFKSAGLKPKIESILVMNAPEWHVSYATGYAILLAKKHRAKITILSAVQTDRELEKERGYSARLAEMCRTHGVGFEEKFVKARNIVDTVVEEAKSYDLLALGASTEWRLTQFAFGPWQDQIARRTETPTLMVRKVRRKEEPVPTRSPVPLPSPPPPQPS
ncbi:MAG TPA: amino acid permease [Thermoplasmata archaeon]|nr:amino acid permease [Thermoplasmata archaeon]